MTDRRTPLTDDRLLVALDAALQAGELHRSHSGQRLLKTHASSDELVTEADVESEQLIIDHIRSQYPDEAILAEESGQDSTGSRQWVVDPLDGTVNFFHGVPDYAVSVAIEDPAGVEAGVVYSVPRDTVFTAVRGEGAYRETSPLAVSGEHTLDESLIATGFPSTEAVSLTTISSIIDEAHGVRRLGSAALDLAYVAAGWYEGFYQQGLNSWDTAAGRLLVEEAGGTVSTLSEEIVAAGEIFLATNGRIHSELTAQMRE